MANKMHDMSIQSSYAPNKLGEVLRAAAIILRPHTIIEFGVYEGYSTIYLSQALKELGRGHLHSYDLWDKYQFRHTSQEKAQANLNEYGAPEYVTLGQKDFYEWLRSPTPFDLLHLDISNDGDIIEKTITTLQKTHKGSTIIFEGGTPQRDNVDWMIQYNKKLIAPLKNKLGFKILAKAFPSLSIKQL